MATTMTVEDLQNQLSGLQEYKPEDEATLRKRAEAAYAPQYQQDLQSLQRTLETNLAAQDRSALRNGMQRSSYNQAQQASLRTGGAQAQAQLGAAYEGNVGQALLNLMEAEKNRKADADANRDSLLLQLYNLMPKGGGKPKEEKEDDPLAMFKTNQALKNLAKIIPTATNLGAALTKSGQMQATGGTPLPDYMIYNGTHK